MRNISNRTRLFIRQDIDANTTSVLHDTSSNQTLYFNLTDDNFLSLSNFTRDAPPIYKTPAYEDATTNTLARIPILEKTDKPIFIECNGVG